MWPLVGAIAVLWPDRALSPFDGIPLDRAAEAIVVGLLLPALWWLHPQFLRSWRARAIIVALALWKLSAPIAFTQQGLCGQFTTVTPYFAGGGLVPRSWDARTNWREPVPACSAIVARPYQSRDRFPVWFLNVSAHESRESALPPLDAIALQVSGYLTAAEAGTLSLSASLGEHLTITLPSGRVDIAPGETADVRVPAGVHAISIGAQLREGPWRLEPRWNSGDLWTTALTTVGPPTRIDRAFGSAARAVTPVCVLLVATAWLVAALRKLRPTSAIVAWMLGASAVMAAAGWSGYAYRFTAVLLLAGAAVPVPRRLRNLRGVFLLLGIPWLVFFAAGGFSQIGQVTFYTTGDDWITYQRLSHRVFMEGYWLEGGSRTFWVQPLYRWLAGSLHVLFGDSSIGELYVDVGSMLAGVLLCAHLTRRWAGFRWGVFAGAVTATTFLLSPTWWIIGRGLSEPSAAGFAYLAAFFILRGRRSSIGWCVAGGVMAILAFWSRLNHLPFVLSMVALFLPPRLPAGRWPGLATGMARVRWRGPAVFVGVFATGVGLLALRTWHYTGVFSVLYGTQYQTVATGLGPWTTTPSEGLGHVLRHVWISVSRFATFDQPSLSNVRAVPMVGGVLATILGILRVPLFRTAPLALTLLCLGALVSPALVLGGSYPGRTSLHFVPFATAMFVGTLAAAAERAGWRLNSQRD